MFLFEIKPICHVLKLRLESWCMCLAIKEEHVINHGVRLRGDLRSSFEEEPEKQLGLLRSFVFVQNIIVAEQNPSQWQFFFFPKSN